MRSLPFEFSLQPLPEYEPPLGARCNSVAATPSLLGRHRRSRTVVSSRVDARAGAKSDLPTYTVKRIRAILVAILEVQAGIRTPGQLRDALKPSLYRKLCAQNRSGGARYILGAIHTCQLDSGAIEVSGIVRATDRFLALSARFEWVNESWRCTVFNVLTPDASR